MKKLILLFVVALMITNVSGQIVSSWKSKRVDDTNNKYYKIGTISLPTNYCMFNGTFYSSFQQIGTSMETSFIKYSISARNTNGSIILKIIHNGSFGKNGYSANVIGLINGTVIDIYVGGINASYQYPSHSLLGYSINVGGTFSETENDEGTTTLPSGTQVAMNKSFFIDDSGNVGIGTTTTTSLLTLGSATSVISTNTSDGSDNKRIGVVGGGALSISRGAYVIAHGNEYATDGGALWLSSGDVSGSYIDFRPKGSVAVRIKENGNVLIGKISQVNTDYMLDVAGSIRANEVRIDLDGADFVFEPDYKLKSLNEVESFIKKNKRLPDIESASKMETDGANLGELNTILLQKIEELTLYVIEQNKKIENMQQLINELKK